MTKLTKRNQVFKAKCAPGKTYSVDQALKMLLEFAQNKPTATKFDQTMEMVVILGVDTRKSDQTVRGASLLPHGTGKTVRVAVFAQGDKAEDAKAAGADIVGFEDLAAEVKQGKMDFDVVIATPDAMRIVGTLGQVLGPRGLMPNPKVGTVTPDVSTAVKNAKSGQVRFRADKAGIVHAAIGKASFEPQKLKENMIALLNDIKKVKPSSAKGIYLKKISLTSTMGPGLIVELASIES